MMKRVGLLLWLMLLVPLFGMAQPVEKACFSVPGGFYEESPVLEIFPFYPQHHIRFTVNGNRPTAQSQLYTEPLLLDDGLYSTSDIFTIQVAPADEMFYPDSVPHCIVIRAAVFDENDSCISEVATHSYFIHSLGCDTHGLPVVSICADSLDLFDYHRGIFVPGVWFDPENSSWSGNYYMRGDEWERPINFEFYELDNQGINQIAGIRTHGGNGRRHQQKCVKIYAREEYGKKRFEYKFYDSIPVESFKHLVLKPFMASWNQSGMSNYVCDKIATQLDLETLGTRPTSMYINGEYWGVYYINERPDEHYLEDHFDVDMENLNLVNGWYPHLDYGSLTNFNALFHWFETADLTQPDNYAYACDHIDINNFIDYYCFELFIENSDRPANNVRFWQQGDGPWRWIFFDGDAALRWMTFFAFDNAVYDGDETWPSDRKATLFFRKLLENNSFKEQFKNRFLELLSTAFDYSITGAILDEISTKLTDEIPLQSARFGFPDSVAVWERDKGRIQYFLSDRANCIIDYIYSLTGNVFAASLQNITCYPNPTSGTIYLVFESDYTASDEIALFDVTGRQVYRQQVSLDAGPNFISINPPLAPGLYMLKCNGFTLRVVRY